MVGAVVLDAQGRLVGEGYHRRAGEAHAEVVALERAGSRARGGTVYVSLEPCCHRGRTGPCTEALLEAGVGRVVVAMRDPDPRVRGEGLRRLRESGVEVSEGLLEGEARHLNEFYVTHRTHGRPFVTAKLAVSLDGRIATRTGDSRWITGEVARAHAHLLRHQHDAVLVGVGTVLADDPELTARFPGARQPLKVVLDGSGRTPPSAKVLRGPHLVDSGRDLPGLLRRLASMGILSLLVEGGGQVHGSFFDQGLVDRVHAYMSPMVIGGSGARAAVGGEGAATIAESWRLVGVEVTRLGPDVVVSGYVHRDRDGPG